MSYTLPLNNSQASQMPINTAQPDLKNQSDIYSQLAHELKNPLTSIILTTQMLKKMLELDFTEENRERLEATVNSNLSQLNRLNKVIDIHLESE